MKKELNDRLLEINEITEIIDSVIALYGIRNEMLQILSCELMRSTRSPLTQSYWEYKEGIKYFYYNREKIISIKYHDEKKIYEVNVLGECLELKPDVEVTQMALMTLLNHRHPLIIKFNDQIEKLIKVAELHETNRMEKYG